MEASSPLAAMQPPVFLGYPRCNKDLMPMAPPRSFGANDFNFKDLSMRMAMKKKSQPDYFNIKPVPGSSPTTDLVADLSQNFTIDQSPVVPTPRRALFSNNVFAVGGVSLTTPPVPSSSPGIQDVDMDISPLPHKPARYSTALQSPTPDITPNESICMPSPPRSGSRPDSAPPYLQPERRKTAPLRPSLVKAKSLSSSLVEQQRPSLPPFRFGNYQDTKPATASSLSLEQIFEESSPLRETSSPITAFQAARSRPLFDSTNTRSGSPLSVHMRKASTQTNSTRPRKQFRRAQSMYQTADDVMKQDTLPPVPAITEVECGQKLRLPTVAMDQANELPRINKETMIEVLDGKYDDCYSRRVIIDCRFEYEYEGGHIKGAQNYNDKQTLAAQLFEVEPSLQSTDPTKPSLIIFHCEYSAHRAPLMAKFIRNKDRSVNAERYPALTYPEMYILDGGYSSFFKEYRARCFPQNYVEMGAKEHAAACERGMGKVKHAQRSKLQRAQTFAFGQHSPQHDSSPTAMGRCRTGEDVRTHMDMDVDMALSYTPAKPDIRRPVARLQSFPLS
ncbi:hypothetical protein DV737_g1177, partial [Chaetothyriales sp. CBS 132003]